MIKIKARLSEQWQALKEVGIAYQQLQASLTNLQDQSAGLMKTVNALQRAMHRYEFKNRPHLEKINQKLAG